MESIQITPGVEWNKWKDNPPAPKTWVWARFCNTDTDKAVLVKTCRCARCTVYTTDGWDLVIPFEWTPVTDEEGKAMIAAAEEAWAKPRLPGPHWSEFAD